MSGTHVSNASGGAPAIPGLSSDGQIPGGIVVEGAISSDEGLIYSDGAGNLRVGGNIINPTVQSGQNNGNALTVTDHNGTSIAIWSIFGLSTVGNVSTVNGKLLSALGLGIWGHPAPANQPVLATGASATVDDVIALIQSYGLCKQV